MTRGTVTTPPYPRLGEIYRTVAVAIDTKSGILDPQRLDRAAREGEFDWNLWPVLGEQLLIDPLKKHVESDFLSMIEGLISDFNDQYLGMVKSVSLETLTRAEALPLLLEKVFVPWISELMFLARIRFNSVKSGWLFEPDSYPIWCVMNSLCENEDPLSLARLVYPDSSGADREEFEKVRKWVTGKDIPRLQSINRFCDHVARVGRFSEDKVQQLRVWLIIGRGISHVEQKLNVAIRHNIRNYLFSPASRLNLSPAEFLGNANTERFSKFAELQEPLSDLETLLSCDGEKEAGDKERSREIIFQLDTVTDPSSCGGRLRHHLEFALGRWHVLSGDVEGAADHYDKAVEFTSYRAGGLQRIVTEEALVVAAYLKKKAFLKKIKNRAIGFGFLPSPSAARSIEDWEMKDLIRRFHEIFPSYGRFKEAAPYEPMLPRIIVDQGKIGKMRADFGNPDRVRRLPTEDEQIVRWPQLHIFVRQSKLTEVKRLLLEGATVDQLNESGESALLIAINQAETSEGRQVLDVLLEQTHAYKTINILTKRKRISPLFSAIDLGDPELVLKLLEMGADANLRGQVDNQTPLYFTIGRLFFTRDQSEIVSFLEGRMLRPEDNVYREVCRRYNIPDTGGFGDPGRWQSMMQSGCFRPAFKQLLEEKAEEVFNRFDKNKLLQICQLLLAYKADPNARQEYPVAGRTPLMLAAENDDVEAFEMMVAFGGDPQQQDRGGSDAGDIAQAFGSSGILESRSFFRRK